MAATHKARKEQVLAAVSRAAMSSYVPTMEAIVDATLARFAREGEHALAGELETLAVHLIAANVIGIEDEAEVIALRDEYRMMATALGALPINLPGTPLNKGLKAVKRLMTRLGGYVAERRKEPGEDGLSRILAAKASDGSSISDEDAAAELHHMIAAGYIVYAAFMAAMIQLQGRDDLRAEVAEALGDGPQTAEGLFGNDVLMHLVMEIKRHAMVVPFAIGLAKRDFEVGGYAIQSGTMLLWGIGASNFDGDVYADPTAFDPSRFAPGRAEHEQHEHAFVPQGSGPMTGHKCAGFDYSSLMIALFAGKLCRDYTWTLASPDPDFDFAVIPPVPKDGLRAKLSPR